ncbi:hypothetical protein [Ramlibacter sp.]|uniref:hypothetical protein n=1 Tax=Ramlibacter sp. TaxID=1917967 RepID=UPI00257EBF20|nr:hypothetical protein [Ramlibacter sp.]
MAINPRTPQRDIEAPRDKPVTERTEHANLERPGAQAHPRARSTPVRAARGWEAFRAGPAWRLA